MPNDASRSLVRDLIRARGPAARALVEPVEIHTRTGDQFIVTDPLRGLHEPPTERVVQNREIAAEVYLGSIVVEWGFDVLARNQDLFHRWLFDNELDLFTARPDEGVRYRGTYAVNTTTEPGTGAYRTIWAFDSFQDFDDFGAALADDFETGQPLTAFGELVHEYFAFHWRTPRAGRSQSILIRAAATRGTATLGRRRRR